MKMLVSLAVVSLALISAGATAAVSDADFAELKAQFGYFGPNCRKGAVGKGSHQ